MAVNAADPHHLSFEQMLLPMAVELSLSRSRLRQFESMIL